MTDPEPSFPATWRLTVAYDGTDFWGSQRQAARRTVQGELEAALNDFTGQRHAATFAGRTDRGAHAIGQVVSYPDVRPDLAAETIRSALNARLPGDLAVVGTAREGAAFDARRDAAWREYRYRIWCGGPQPLLRRVVWERRAALNPAPMNEAAARLVGRHDFAAFAGGGDGVPWSERRMTARGTVRTIRHCSVRDVAPPWPAPADAAGRCAEVRVIADGFLPRMVRAIAGALVSIGAGTDEPAWIEDLLRTADRRAGPRTAPPQGLVLWRIGYGDDVPAPDPDDAGNEATCGGIRRFGNG